MAVISVKEIWQGRGGSHDGESLEYIRVYRVITDTFTDDAVAVLSNASLPVYGELHPNDPLAWCYDRAAAQDDVMPTVWTFTAKYQDAKIKLANPEEDEPEITWDGEPFSRVAEVDVVTGSAVLNSAGDPFDPPIEVDDTRPMVTISRNVLTVPTWIFEFRDSVNSAPFIVDNIAVLAGQAKVSKITIGPRKRRGAFFFRPITIVLQLNEDGWKLRPLDRGFRQRSAGQIIAITNADGTEVTEPALLDGNGAAIVDPTGANAVFLAFDGYKIRDFSLLPLN